MATVEFHQDKAVAFLQRADHAIADLDPIRAAVALRRALTHALTALAVHDGCNHNSRRQLEQVMYSNIFRQRLKRDHLKTFRQVHSIADHLASAHRSGDPAVPLRRMRRRVKSCIVDCAAAIAGQPKPVRHHKRRLRDPNHRVPDAFATAQDILSLPNLDDIKRRFNLSNVPLAASPDPHGWYRYGMTPRPCPCHRKLWRLPEDDSVIILSPLWCRALEKTFWIKLPNPLSLRARPLPLAARLSNHLAIPSDDPML